MALVQKKGCCIYCGQIGFADVEEDTPDEAVDMEITLQCECTAAKIKQKRLQYQQKAHEKIETLFAQYPDEIKEFLKEAVILISEGKIGKVSAKITSKITVQINVTQKGNIKIERTTSKKEVEEI